MPLVFFAPLAASGSLLDRRSEHTKGSALVNPLLPPRAQGRGAVKLPHTPERRLGGTAHRQAEYACGGPTDAEPTPKGAGPPPFNLTALRSRARIREGKGEGDGSPNPGLASLNRP